jgi:S4 domain protein YaaA
MNEVKIKTEYITLGQFLKFADVLPSGGIAKYFLQDVPVHVNGEIEIRRGRKLYPNDVVTIEEFGEFLIVD